MTKTQESLVKQLLERHSGWRLAGDADNTDKENVALLRRERLDFQPYFSARRAGVTAEGDFAVALVRDSVFKVYYFRWSGSQYLRPQEVATVDWLANGRIRVSNDTLDIAPFRSDEIFYFVWNPSRSTLELAREPPQRDMKP